MRIFAPKNVEPGSRWIADSNEVFDVIYSCWVKGVECIIYEFANVEGLSAEGPFILKLVEFTEMMRPVPSGLPSRKLLVEVEAEDEAMFTVHYGPFVVNEGFRIVNVEMVK